MSGPLVDLAFVLKTLCKKNDTKPTCLTAVGQDTTIRGLKELISLRLVYPCSVDQQRIVLLDPKNKEEVDLHNDRTVASYHLNSDSELHLVFCYYY